MTILCTFPGKYGDLLWALPTIRAISRRVGAPVHLRIAANFASIVPLLQHQEYLASVKAYPDWSTEDTAPISPRIPPDRAHEAGTLVIHLGYRGWPDPNVAQHTRETAILEINERCTTFFPGGDVIVPRELALETPWIEAPRIQAQGFYWPWQYGFTDEHFELKYGILRLLEGNWRSSILGRPNATLPPIGLGDNPRWRQEAGNPGGTWEEAADFLNHCGVFLSDCSALHVLAVAMGVPTVLVEPQEARWNPVFYPLGHDGPQVTLVKGVDGRPTFDVRHVRDTLTAAVDRRKDQR